MSAFSHQAEQATLGAVLRDGRQAEDLALQPEDFYRVEHQRCWQAVRSLLAKRSEVDIVTVAEALESSGEIDLVGGLPYLCQLAESAVGQKAATYAAIVADYARARAVARIGLDLEGATREDWQTLANEATKQLLAMGRADSRADCSLRDALASALDELETLSKSDGLAGLSSGLADLDRVTGGWHKSDLIVIGARPAMGKTALLLGMCAAAGVPVGLVSAEQPRHQVAARLLASEARVDLERMRTADLDEGDWARLTQALPGLAERQVLINDRSSIRLGDLHRQAREWVRSHQIRGLYVDYLQRLKPDRADIPRHEQVGEIAQGLKEIARELEIPVICLAQVNRTVEARDNKRPMMGDLKSSGDIEQEADMVLMLYRDEVYNEDSPDKGAAELSVEKNRHGRTGFVRVAWDGRFTRFADLSVYPDVEDFA